MNSTWTRETCRRRYVQGDRIGLQALAIESGVPIGTLKRWSSSEEVTWLKQRTQYDEKVRLLTQQKSRERVSTAIAIDNEQIVSQHLELLGILRKLASTFFECLWIKIIEIMHDKPSDPRNDELLEFLKTLGGRVPLQTYSNVLHVAIQGERQALYLDLVDPAILERAANRHGLSLVNLEIVENPNA